MYILLQACENPTVLRLVWFADLFFELLSVVIPIGLITMLLFDFTKAVINNDDSAQSKINKIIVKRILYGIVVFMVPWIVSIVMNVLDTVGLNIGEDYNTCIETVKREDFNIGIYDEAYEKEVAAHKNNPSIGGMGGSNNTTSTTENLMQCDPAWSNTNTCLYPDKNICSSGCGFTSLTMVLRSLGYVDLTPDKIMHELCQGTTRTTTYALPDDFVYIATKYQLKVEKYGAIYSADEAEKIGMPHIQKGHKLIINMPGHYISVVGVEKDGNLAVRDSARGYEYGGRYGYTFKNFKELFNATSWDADDGKRWWLNVTAIYK